MQADRLFPVIGSRYQLEQELGHGGMGAVYRATDLLTGEAVALKRVTTPAENLQFASRISGESGISGRANLRMALAQEFRTLASLRHPNIIRVLDYGFDADQQPYLTMDLLDHPRTLLAAGRGASGQSPSLEVKIDLLVQMLQALAYLHRRGIVHRDLKPDNVAVVRDHADPAHPADRVRVLDFGLALTHDYLHDTNRGMAGTLAYMSPEVLQGDEATTASDLYAVGVMAYELFVGSHPFAAPHVTDLINNVLKTDPDLTPLIDVDSMTRRDSASRQQGASPDAHIGASIDAHMTPLLDAPPDSPADGYLILSGTGENRPSLTEIVARLLAKHPHDRYRDAYAVISDLCSAARIPVPEESAAIRESFLQAARFVGRENELSQLQAALREATAGRGSLWLVGGESGVGKSRLLEELRTRALIAGVLALHGQAENGGAFSTGTPFQLWCDPLRRLALSADVTPDEASVLLTILPDLDALFDAAPYRGSDAPQRITRTIIDLFRRQREPVVVLLEDLQWAGESLDALKRLAPYVEELPLLVVGSFRDDERPTLPDELPQARLLALKRLAEDEIAELSASMLGDTGMEPDVIEFLQRETEGNAFFLVETVRALAEESGGLGSIGRETLPPRLITGGMQQVVWRRLNRVPEWAHAPLKLAAIIGRELDPDLMQYADANVDLEAWFTVCANRAIFEAHEAGWRFAHDKLREALLDALTPDEWMTYARAAAEAIEAVYADDRERYAAALATHWRDAGDLRKEGYYVVIAAKQAEDNSAYPQARSLYERGLEIRAYEDADDPQASLAELHHRLGNTFYKMSEFDRAREQQRMALALYEAFNNRKGIADAINALGEADMRQGLHDAAEAALKQALEIRQELDLTLDIGYSYMNLGVIRANLDDLTGARDLFKRCLDIMEQVGTPRDLARALNNYGITLDLLNEKAQAREIYYRALDIRERDHDLHGVCYSLGNLGGLEFDLEHYAEARPLVERALRLARQVADQMAIASNVSQLGEICLKLKEYDTARDYFQQSLDVRRRIDDRIGIITSTRELGDAARESGDLFSAQEYYREALAMSVENGFEAQAWNTLHAIARLLLAQERRRPALKLLALVRTRRDTPNPKDAELIHELEVQMPPHAFASAVAVGEELTLDAVWTKIEADDWDV